jgi:hypothetical protein
MMMTIRVTQEIVQESGRALSIKDTRDYRLLRHVPSPFQPRSTFRNGTGPSWIVTIPQNHSGMRISRHFSLTRPAKFPDSRTFFPPTTVDPHCPSFQIMPGLPPKTMLLVSTTCPISSRAILLLASLWIFGTVND